MVGINGCFNKMKTIKLTRGFSTIVDDDVFEWAKNYHWWCGQSRKDSSIKALTETAVNGKRVKFSLSRLIMKAPKGMQVDHINHDTLDNRKENLRICTAEENQQNKGFSRNNKCGYKGVHVVVYKTHATYISQIKDHKKVIHLGSFSNAVDAARAYDKAAIKCNGEFACTNEDLGLLNPEKECKMAVSGNHEFSSISGLCVHCDQLAPTPSPVPEVPEKIEGLYNASNADDKLLANKINSLIDWAEQVNRLLKK